MGETLTQQRRVKEEGFRVVNFFYTSAQRAPRRGANGCADVRFLTCAAVQPLIFRPEAALGSGFSLQAAFWYQNAMLALFLRGKKSLKRSLILVPFRRFFLIFIFYKP